MPFIPAENTVELVIQQAMLGQLVNNVLNFQFPDVPDTIDLTTLASAALTAWITNLAPLLSTDLDLNSMKATSLQTGSSPTVTTFAPAGTDGDIGARAEALNVALVISERTAQRGRSYRGRYYQAGVPITATANAGSVLTAYQADILAAFVSFIEDIETAALCEHVVVSRQNNNVPLSIAIVTPITGYSANADFDSQRRRLLGRGA